MKGITQSTGRNWRFKDETGKVHGQLTVIRFSGHQGSTAMWDCLCTCGNNCVVSGAKLRNGHTSSCGCLRISKSKERFTTHGLSDSEEYRIWHGMKDRCYSPSRDAYQYYGARGVTMCQRWLDSFELFLQDMGPRPDGCSIERIDTNGNYEPGNCKWATATEQANNKRNNRHITLNGVQRTFAQWEKFNGLTEGTVSKRIKNGWNENAAVTTPQ